MDSQEFIKKLNNVDELIRQENFKEAINLIEILKEIDKRNNFNYNITHRLYQLDSNSRSLYQQQVILKSVNYFPIKENHISLQQLNQILKSKNNLDLDIDILRREIELLILRGQLPWKINKDQIIIRTNQE